MKFYNYKAPVCKTVELQVRKSLLLDDSNQQLLGINQWDDDDNDGDEYDF